MIVIDVSDVTDVLIAQAAYTDKRLQGHQLTSACTSRELHAKHQAVWMVEVVSMPQNALPPYYCHTDLISAVMSPRGCRNTLTQHSATMSFLIPPKKREERSPCRPPACCCVPSQEITNLLWVCWCIPTLLLFDYHYDMIDRKSVV